MFSATFQEKHYFTLGILKGFLPGMPEKHRKQCNPGQLKIALQGAANRPRGVLGTTLFSCNPVFPRDPCCMPLGASIPFSNCQEPSFPGNKAVFSG